MAITDVYLRESAPIRVNGLSITDILVFPQGPDVSGDTTGPTVNIVSISRTKISRAGTNQPGGVDQLDVVFTVSEDYNNYQVRLVADANATVTAGTLVESGSGGTANTNRTITLTDDELIDVGGAIEGANGLKIFARDLAGNWSN